MEKRKQPTEKDFEKLYHLINKYINSELQHLKDTLDKESNKEAEDLTGVKKAPTIKGDEEINKK